MNENILSLKEALEHYYEGCKIYTLINKKKTFLFIINDKYMLKNEETGLTLLYNEINELFGHADFYKGDESQDVIDQLKDEEYYSWKQ